MTPPPTIPYVVGTTGREDPSALALVLAHLRFHRGGQMGEMATELSQMSDLRDELRRYSSSWPQLSTGESRRNGQHHRNDDERTNNGIIGLNSANDSHSLEPLLPWPCFGLTAFASSGSTGSKKSSSPARK